MVVGSISAMADIGVRVSAIKETQLFMDVLSRVTVMCFGCSGWLIRDCLNLDPNYSWLLEEAFAWLTAVMPLSSPQFTWCEQAAAHHEPPTRTSVG